MEAPEKIYLGIEPIGGDKPNEKYLYAEWDEEPKPMVKNIEYTRTDAFIEKARKWLDDHIIDYMEFDEYSEMLCGFNEDRMIEDFKNYMKGE